MDNNVLIVDDSILIQKALTKLIGQNRDFRVIAAVSTGEEAIRLCKEQKPDLVFIDVMLPGMDGLEASRKIKKISPDTDICIISAYQSIKLMKKALGLNIKAYLNKPFSPEDIHAILTEYKTKDRIDSEKVLERIDGIIDAKDFHKVYECPKEIAAVIFALTGGNKEMINSILQSIKKHLQNRYMINSYEYARMAELFPVNPELMNDEIMIEMWLSKILDFVYRYRFVERYVSAKPVFEYIEEHIKECINMTAVIENCHISQQYISRLFKEQMKMSALDYIQTRKMMMAKWYIYFGKHSTLDIAVMLGYGDAGYFAKVFKKYEKITPYQYKTQLSERV